jgi:hypothetical protein
VCYSLLEKQDFTLRMCYIMLEKQDIRYLESVFHPASEAGHYFEGVLQPVRKVGHYLEGVLQPDREAGHYLEGVFRPVSVAGHYLEGVLQPVREVGHYLEGVLQPVREAGHSLPWGCATASYWSRTFITLRVCYSQLVKQEIALRVCYSQLVKQGIIRTSSLGRYLITFSTHFQYSHAGGISDFFNLYSLKLFTQGMTTPWGGGGVITLDMPYSILLSISVRNFCWSRLGLLFLWRIMLSDSYSSRTTSSSSPPDFCHQN